MKIFRHLILVLASLAVFSSCMKEEEKTVATAIMTDKQSLEFGIEEELAQTLTVYADAPWTVETPSWITVDPANGPAGETEVLVTAKANIREALADRPRSAEITFKGLNMYADATVTALQQGDKYRDLVEGTFAEAFEQAAETFVGVKDIQVVALTSNGFVAKDATAISYVAADKTVAIGDKGNVYAYVTTFNGTPSLKNTDKVTVTGNSAVEYGAAKDITSDLQTYAPEQIEYVTVKGKLASKKIEAYSEDGSATGTVYVELLNAHSSLNMSELDGWLVEAKGYVFGKSGDVVYLVPVSLEGIQSLETIYFADDFEWMAGYSNVDAVGSDDQSTSVTNIWKADWAESFFAKFNEIGYQYLWSTVGDKDFKAGVEQAPNPSIGKEGSMYACKNYLKFGQTSYSGALRLPALSTIQGTVNVQIDFDWCWQVTGANKPDIMTVSVETTNGKFEQTGLAMSENLESAQSLTDGESHLAWNHATVILTEATAETVLTIRPTYADPDKQNAARHQNRWYLDNIKIIEYTGNVSVAQPTEAEITITMENNITFDAAPTEAKTFKFVSDQEATLAIEADWMYFLEADGTKVKELSIAASAPTTVSVVCDENTGSEPRTADILITSGLSEEKIPVTQMSPGQMVESFVSIIGGNSGKVGFGEGSFNLSVQANVDFKFESDAAWATVQALPESKALVEVKELVVNYEANTQPVERTARIRVYNEANNLETVYTLTQDAFVSGVYFQDDFTWVSPWADAYGSGDSVGENDHSGKAPNVYTQATQAGFLDEFTKRGYVDLNPTGQVMYTQKYYLKFGKTNVHTGITLPEMEFEGDTPVNAEITFDWCAHMITKEPYTYDKVQMVVELTGPGVCADSQGKVSNAYATKQKDGFMEWQKFSVVLSGVTKDTRISIRPLDWDKTGTDGDEYKVQRYHLDNVKVEKYEGAVPTPGLQTLAVFPFPHDTAFDASTVTDATGWNLAEGWILSEDGKSKLSSHNPDGSALKVTYKYEASSDEGLTKDHVRVLATGMAKGGYWLFEMPIKDMAAGQYNIKYKQSSSNTGANYFLVEVSVDGQNWTAIDAKTSTETFKDGSSPREVTYTYALNKLGANAANIAYDVNLTYDAPAIPGENTLYIRATVADTMEYRATKELASSGTNRIWGPCEVTFQK